eukprot:TRINITY_DN16965_c0_g1_i1.p1 TRINITY_DN16965_c0_g1~~TRINITY_DN16965_c0_g1_i1.p1  ORF type:complete len:363 (+),score=49.92 TRINITY_DN16965_c0_g1_i1:67-1155(+)
MLPGAERSEKSLLGVLPLIFIWYASSAVGNMTSKMILMRFPYPVTVMMGPVFVGFMSVPILAALLPARWSAMILSGNPETIHTGQWNVHSLLALANTKKRLCFALGLLSLGGGLFHRIALVSVHVSFAHTVKAIQPLYACTFSYFILHHTPTCLSLLALFVIIIGIMMSVASEIHYDGKGMFALHASVACLSLSSVFQKGVLVGLDKAQVYALITGTAAALNSFLWIVYDLPVFHSKWSTDSSIFKKTDGESNIFVVVLFLVNSLTLAVQHFSSLSALQHLTPTTHSVVACMKRVVVIVANLMFFQNHMDVTNRIGIAIAVLGVVLYDRARKMGFGGVASPGPPPTSLFQYFVDAKEEPQQV